MFFGFLSISKNAEGKTVALFTELDNPMQGELVPFEKIFRLKANEYDLDWRLIAAHAFVESSFNPRAFNKEGPTSDGSYGLMQIYLTFDRAGKINRKLNVDHWPPINAEALFDPAYNVSIGAQIIKENQRWGFPRSIAMYNRYAERLAPVGGPFVNQVYVDRVVKKYNELKGLTV